ncbi:MAG: Crp/Fnr family transcriptional regulator [Thiohalomonadales bacterium]
MSNYKKKLLKHFSNLSEQDQCSLVSYAEFLVNRENPSESANQEITEPLQIPRPDNESVIKAIKRLSATYPMLDKSVLLNEISTHMTQHIIHGVSATEVINNLESEFLKQYKKWQC